MACAGQEVQARRRVADERGGAHRVQWRAMRENWLRGRMRSSPKEGGGGGGGVGGKVAFSMFVFTRIYHCQQLAPMDTWALHKAIRLLSPRWPLST